MTCAPALPLQSPPTQRIPSPASALIQWLPADQFLGRKLSPGLHHHKVLQVSCCAQGGAALRDLGWVCCLMHDIRCV